MSSQLGEWTLLAEDAIRAASGLRELAAKSCRSPQGRFGKGIKCNLSMNENLRVYSGNSWWFQQLGEGYQPKNDETLTTRYFSPGVDYFNSRQIVLLRLESMQEGQLGTGELFEFAPMFQIHGQNLYVTSNWVTRLKVRTREVDAIRFELKEGGTRF